MKFLNKNNCEIKKQRGFTLIELLVVIAIIGILSSVVLASLNSARTKARDAAIISAVGQFEKLLALEYSDNGSYAKLKDGNWLPNFRTCNTIGFTGDYAVQAKSICSNIFSNLIQCSETCMYFSDYVSTVPHTDNNKYSIVVKLSSGYFCKGSSGGGKYSDPWGSDPNNHPELSPLGCMYNP